MDIGITNVCNLKCTFCARTVRVDEGRWRKAQHMDLDLFKKIIDEAVELGTYSINMNLLNEPLTHPKIMEMIRYAKQKGIIDVHFHSHGGLLDEEKANQLLDSGLQLIELLEASFQFDDALQQNLRDFFFRSRYAGRLLATQRLRDEQ